MAKANVANRITAADLLNLDTNTGAVKLSSSLTTRIASSVVGSFKAGNATFGDHVDLAYKDALDQQQFDLQIRAHEVAERMNARRATLAAFLAKQ